MEIEAGWFVHCWGGMPEMGIPLKEQSIKYGVTNLDREWFEMPLLP